MRLKTAFKELKNEWTKWWMFFTFQIARLLDFFLSWISLQKRSSRTEQKEEKEMLLEVWEAQLSKEKCDVEIEKQCTIDIETNLEQKNFKKNQSWKN